MLPGAITARLACFKTHMGEPRALPVARIHIQLQTAALYARNALLTRIFISPVTDRVFHKSRLNSV